MDYAQKTTFDHNGPNTVQNLSKLMDIVIRIELTGAILMARFSNFLRNSIIHLRRFLYLATCYLRVTVSLLCRLQAVSKIHVPIHPYLISEGTLSPARHETVTLRKHVDAHIHDVHQGYR